MITTCKHCQQPLVHVRAGAQYHPACRVAAWRQRHKPVLPTSWCGEPPRPRRAREELGERLLEIAAQEDEGAPKTGRRYYYLALSYGYITPSMAATVAAKAEREAAYDRITSVLGILRKQGKLSWGMVLDLTRELDEWPAYSSPREARAAMRRYYDEDRWIGQLRYPILIVEKDTLEPVCKPMAQSWQMPFASSRGYSSLTLQHDVADMLCRRYALTGQMTIVYFVSDLDPSGLDLQRAWEEALADFGAPVARFIRIGLTREQVEELPDVLRDGIEVKPSDSRSKGYIAGVWRPLLGSRRAVRGHDRGGAGLQHSRLAQRRALECSRHGNRAGPRLTLSACG